MTERRDAEDLAIERALDAASAAETQGADAQAVEDYRDVLAHMPVPEVTPRAELEDRVIAAALQRRPAAVPSLAGRRTRRYRQFRVAALAAATVAAAIVVGVMVDNGNSGSPVPHGHVTLAALQHSDIDALLRSPGARRGGFVPAPARVVIAPDGNAAVYDIKGVDAVSVGLVSAGGTTLVGPARPDGGAIAFVVDHPERVTAVTIVRNGVEIARAGLKSA
ncbi:MAG TPA: hypothetical protein VGP92_12835 [Acidimicrobiia bacterium]|jgi:hypothetical protein|nr:hypothetical protein [Acidimicrobiia bacterium]